MPGFHENPVRGSSGEPNQFDFAPVQVFWVLIDLYWGIKKLKSLNKI
jgi:hypothetical protein